MLYFNLETFIGRKTLYILKSCRINSASTGFYLRKKVAGSTRRLRGPYLGQSPECVGRRPVRGESPRGGCPPPLVGGFGGRPQRKFWKLDDEICHFRLSGDHFCSSIQESDSLSICLEKYIFSCAWLTSDNKVVSTFVDLHCDWINNLHLTDKSDCK